MGERIFGSLRFSFLPDAQRQRKPSNEDGFPFWSRYRFVVLLAADSSYRGVVLFLSIWRGLAVIDASPIGLAV